MCIHFQRSEIPVLSFVDQEGVTWYRANDIFTMFEMDRNQIARIVTAYVHPDYRKKSSIGTRGTAWCVTLPGVYQLALKSHTKVARSMMDSLFASVYRLEAETSLNGIEGQIRNGSDLQPNLYKVN